MLAFSDDRGNLLLVTIATGGDGGGSIRIPAGFNGLVGMKGTRDRVPNLPDGFDYAAGFVVDHVVSRTVRDTAAMLDLTHGSETGSRYAAPAPARPYLSELDRDPRPLRIAASVAWLAVGGALAGKAAEGLEKEASIPSRTLSSWELRWRQGRDLLDARSVFVLDEAGMVSSRQMALFVEAVTSSGANVPATVTTATPMSRDPEGVR